MALDLGEFEGEKTSGADWAGLSPTVRTFPQTSSPGPASDFMVRSKTLPITSLKAGKIQEAAVACEPFFFPYDPARELCVRPLRVGERGCLIPSSF